MAKDVDRLQEELEQTVQALRVSTAPEKRKALLQTMRVILDKAYRNLEIAATSLPQAIAEERKRRTP
jgi:hypothetical protein